MSVEIKDKDRIKDIIENMSKLKLQYETKKAVKKGYSSIEEYIQEGLYELQKQYNSVREFYR